LYNFKPSLQQQDVYYNSETLTYSVNLGLLFDEHLTFSEQISALSKSCYSRIRQLRCIRLNLDSQAARSLQPPSYIPN